MNLNKLKLDTATKILSQIEFEGPCIEAVHVHLDIIIDKYTRGILTAIEKETLTIGNCVHVERVMNIIKKGII